MQVVTLEDLRVFDRARMRKNPLFQSSRFFCDLYCLEAGQSQTPHVHQDADKVYVVLEGEGTFRIGEEQAALEAGQAVIAPAGVAHGVANEGPDRLVCLVFLAPRPPSAP